MPHIPQPTQPPADVDPVIVRMEAIRDIEGDLADDGLEAQFRRPIPHFEPVRRRSERNRGEGDGVATQRQRVREDRIVGPHQLDVEAAVSTLGEVLVREHRRAHESRAPRVEPVLVQFRPNRDDRAFPGCGSGFLRPLHHRGCFLRLGQSRRHLPGRPFLGGKTAHLVLRVRGFRRLHAVGRHRFQRPFGRREEHIGEDHHADHQRYGQKEPAFHQCSRAGTGS